MRVPDLFQWCIAAISPNLFFGYSKTYERIDWCKKNSIRSVPMSWFTFIIWRIDLCGCNKYRRIQYRILRSVHLWHKYAAPLILSTSTLNKLCMYYIHSLLIVSFNRQNVYLTLLLCNQFIDKFGTKNFFFGSYLFPNCIMLRLWSHKRISNFPN